MNPARRDRLARLTSLALLLVSAGSAGDAWGPSAQDPGAALAAVRRAVGNDQTAVRSLTLHGTLREGFDGVTARPLETPMPFEMRVLLPDHYVRIHTYKGTQRIFDGFSNGRAFYRTFLIRPDGSLDARPPQEVGRALLDIHRAYARRLLLGILADPGALTPALRVAREHFHHTITFADGDDQEITLEMSKDSRLPHRVRYVSEVHYPEPMTDADKKAGRMGSWTTTTAELTFTFEDHRAVGSLRLPHRIRQTALGRRFQEIQVERYEVNPRLTPKDFTGQD
jgi:hypothetical protein